MSRAGAIALSPDGRHLYVNSPSDSAVTVWAVEQPEMRVAIASVGPLRGTAVRVRLTCANRRPAGCFGRLVAEPSSGPGRAGRRTPIASATFDVPGRGAATVTLRIPAAAIAAARARGELRVYLIAQPAEEGALTTDPALLPARATRGATIRIRRPGR
jgi:hypothetical protein